jgi:peroxiredoxin
MRSWAKEHTCGDKVKCLADGNGEFTRRMGMLVEKTNLGFGMRSWRYAAVINNGIVEQMFEEEGMEDNHGEDPYEVSTPENILERI